MKRILTVVLCSVMLFGVIGCEYEETADQVQANKTKALTKEMNSQIGMPAIKNFTERKLAKMIFELRDKEDLITYAYLVNKMTGNLVYLGKCIGFGLPYSVQYTNPMKRRSEYSDAPPMPQADPNGLFMPQGLSATWLMMIDPKTNKPRPVYIEPEIVVSPFKLKGK